ncbi:CHAP domain-containing protein [Mycobacterium ahvazicum]|uniref:CHAP domain-containing protein n=1 Tax=Mycobacterium ahvazicum TaxID=1964395 RepID=A0A2K4YE93_9MYCO|nr:CHAP domain-containing protein [Mycobacterium ahvazicum]SOX55110.1 CHAP domain-containing protein [Mycobacterium ahvazicum]
MKRTGIMAAVAVSSALSLGASMAPAPASGDPAASVGRTIDHNPFSGDYEGYCTWGAQEQIHAHTGYYIKALTGNAEDWANQARAAGWTVSNDAQAHSIAVFSSALVGGVGHVAWVDAVDGNRLTITEMNMGYGATAANGFRTTGFHQFDTRSVAQAPGMTYILIP